MTESLETQTIREHTLAALDQIREAMETSTSEYADRSHHPVDPIADQMSAVTRICFFGLEDICDQVEPRHFMLLVANMCTYILEEFIKPEEIPAP